MDLQSTEDYIDDGCEGFPPICFVVEDQYGGVPEEQSPGAKQETVCKSYTNAFCKTTPLPQFQCILKRLRVFIHSFTLSYIRIHCSNLCNNLRKKANKIFYKIVYYMFGLNLVLVPKLSILLYFALLKWLLIISTSTTLSIYVY